MKKFVIIDGNSLLFRAYYATAGSGQPLMRTRDGIPTNALFAFANMIEKLIKDFNGDEYILVAFDTDKKTFRHEQNENYKAQRKPAPDDLVPQFQIARDFLSALGIFQYEVAGYEADDIAGTAAKIAANDGYQVFIYTSDKDYLQLIDERITICLIKRSLSNIEIMDEKNMVATFGFKPQQIIDYKGLCGDPSDNLPGIPGIGDVTAKKLIAEYESFDKIIEAAPMMKGKIKENILANIEQGRLSYEMAKIIVDMDLPFTIEDTKYHGYDLKTLTNFTIRYELNLFRSHIDGKFAQDTLTEKFNDKVPTTASFKNISIGDDIGLIALFDSGNYHQSNIQGFALYSKNKKHYISWSDFENDQQLKAAFSNPKVRKYTFDYKKLRVALAAHSYQLNGLALDVLLAGYNLESSLSSDPNYVYNFFGKDLPVFINEPNAEVLKALAMAEYAFTLAPEIEKRLTEAGVNKIYTEIELPLSEVLAKMEIEGFPLDRVKLLEIGENFHDQLTEISARIIDLVGHDFNIASPKQVATVLFDELKLPANKKRSTSSDNLDALRHLHPVVDLILQHRKYAKLTSTYIEGLKDTVYADGKIHATFNQALTTTGRISSSEPNLQNISIRDEEGRLIRKAFYYPNYEFEILSLDYSQIELRVLAALSKCQKFIDAFKQGDDIHLATARQIFQKQEITDLDRRKAKEVNFGIVYGISDWGLAERLSIPPKEAKVLIDTFYNTYPEVGTFLQNVIADAEKNGYVETLLGRRRYLRQIHDPNYQVRAFARRAAMNAPIQGTAADLIKVAMVKIDEYLTNEHLQTKLVLQIHDELIFKVPKVEKTRVEKELKKIMESALDLPVPLKVEGQFGLTWYEAK
ncbi:MAG: DNA polymerase I [Bacilli bacterium]|jgi:DNA polymerase-1|nr:DNA polymerase I [Bacilli bacterium]MDY0399111.1 DNA polymerase I [Bacilli bacterium]